MNCEARLDKEQIAWKNKATNKAKLINREIRKSIKENIKDIYIPYGRVCYSYDTECGKNCGNDEINCDTCDNWGVCKIEVSSVLDIYYQDKYYMLIIEANDCKYIDDTSYDEVKYIPGLGDAMYYLNKKNVNPKYICDYFNNISLIDYSNNKYDNIFSKTKVDYRDYINKIIEVITK